MAVKGKSAKRVSTVKVGKPGSYRHGKAHFVDVVIANTGAAKRSATAAVDGIIDALVGTVKKTGEVKIPGLGVFRRRLRAARKGINPFTKQPTIFKASKRVVFRAAKAFKDSV
jgi:DNA-binding protein HU-beta